MSIVVVGKNSFLAQALVREPACQDWRFLSHSEALADTAWVPDASTVINFAFDPDFKVTGYEAERDVDSSLARLIAPSHAHYIMLSSRAVYGPGDGEAAFTEDHPARPVTPYAMAKYAAEQALAGILPPARLTILRLSNVFGHEYGRPTFFGMALSGLKDKGVITFDMSPTVRRDFYASWRCAASLATIAQQPQPGLFNLGAGFGTACGQVAEWLIEGYGSGTLRVIDETMKDPFWLDMAKTAEVYGLPAYSPQDLRQDCVSCGEKLKSF